MKKIHFDVFVIGSGIAGQTVAQQCASNGFKVAVSDNREFGGTCANRGCDPKKVLMQFAYYVHKGKQLKSLGVDELPKINWKSVQEFKKTFTQKVPKGTEEHLKDLGITLYHQSPRFVSESEIEVEGKRVSAKKFVIATGLIPRTLKFPGSEYLKISDDVLKLKKIPKSAVFLGSGYVGMEFAYMLSTMGCKVTLIDRSERALKPFDDFLTEKLVESMKANGVDFIFSAEVKKIEKLRKNLKVNLDKNGEIKTLKARKVFNTAGRVPAIEQLDLDSANIAYDSKGVIVNDFLQSKTNKNVYACGDVANLGIPLTPLTGLQADIVAQNIIQENSKVFEAPLVPSVVFTYPNIATVGYSEKEANSRFKNIKVYKGEVADWYNAKKENLNAYAYKFLVNERTDEIIGAHLLSPQASENINILSMAIEKGISVTEFKKLIFTYPSFTSDIKSMFAD